MRENEKSEISPKHLKTKGSKDIMLFKKGILKKSRIGNVAEKGGFEPPKPVLRACTLSRGVPSASRPLFRTS